MVDGPEIQLYFHTDGSVEDWGYRFTATPKYPAKPSGASKVHWLARLEFEMVQCSAAIAAVMVKGLPYNDELEGSHSAWIENSLIR